MNKKGSMELSVNSIVILVIAIVIMGLILGFIRSKFSEVGGNLVTNEPDPQVASYDDRLTLSRETMSVVPGSQAVLKINVFNPTAYDFVSARPVVTCSGISGLTFSANTKNIPTGSQASFVISLSVSKTAGRGGSILCSVAVNASNVIGYRTCSVPTGTCTQASTPTPAGANCNCMLNAVNCGMAQTCAALWTGWTGIPGNGCGCMSPANIDFQSYSQISPKDFVVQVN
jgi:hypothetical protein